ncbi:hypothetical protein B0H66DRAFT_531667 [Apodospora peruviana]|uniref:Uncharacterized protein n=1 Tax=Apodospora peruviana TaxID=516989 RepID=A0AAE0M7I2_9PEZI|nr:hypothetical protein B0H66DRAFT_531667 [Apodospora peruviana]
MALRGIIWGQYREKNATIGVKRQKLSNESPARTHGELALTIDRPNGWQGKSLHWMIIVMDIPSRLASSNAVGTTSDTNEEWSDFAGAGESTRETVGNGTKEERVNGSRRSDWISGASNHVSYTTPKRPAAGEAARHNERLDIMTKTLATNPLPERPSEFAIGLIFGPRNHTWSVPSVEQWNGQRTRGAIRGHAAGRSSTCKASSLEAVADADANAPQSQSSQKKRNMKDGERQAFAAELPLASVSGPANTNLNTAS